MLPRRARSGQAWKSARGAAAALLDRAGEYAERGPKRTLGDDGEDPSFFPRRIDRRPVVIRRDEGSFVDRRQRVAVDMADLGLDLAQDRPCDLTIRNELRDGHGYVV